MDPNATVTQLCEALEGGRLSDALACVESLQAWIGRGGFVPDNYGDVVLALRDYATRTRDAAKARAPMPGGDPRTADMLRTAHHVEYIANTLDSE